MRDSPSNETDPGLSLQGGISVVIPTFNYARYLPLAIESVLAQTIAPLEIIVADDGSTDNTQEVVRQYGDAVEYRRFKHMGVYAVRGAMLNGIRGNWFLNLDADNWLAPDFLEQMAKVIAANESDGHFAFAYPDMEVFGESTGLVERPEFDAERLKTGNFIDMNSVIRTAVARRFGFDPAFNAGQGDYDFFLTLAENGYKGVRVPAASLHYRTHSGSLSRLASRRCLQRDIMQRIIRKHRRFYSLSDARAALAAADNRILVALIDARSPFAGFRQRFLDWAHFARAGFRHAEFCNQTKYLFAPRRYLGALGPPPDVFYLFKENPDRRALVRRVLCGRSEGIDCSQLFAFKDLARKGIRTDCNLRFPRESGANDNVLRVIERAYAPRTGIGRGDVRSVRVHLDLMNRARVVLATSDNTGLPAARLKQRRLLQAPLVYVSIGLPERIMAVERISPARAARYRRRLMHADRFVAYGWNEAEWLKRWTGDPDRVRFIPFGVNTDLWRPGATAGNGPDIISIGADFMRDFQLLVEYARSHPEINVCLVSGKECSAGLGALPSNIQLRIQVPPEELRILIAGAGVVVLPVKENTYSGATTTLLQCMAMGKAVAVSRVGAICGGYGFKDGVNLCWMEPGSAESLARAAGILLSDESARRRIGVAAREHVETELNWNRYASRMEDCLMDWLEGAKG